MTEAEWLVCADPLPMLEHLRRTGAASERKLWLFTAACCRRVWNLLTEPGSRAAVETLERFADGAASGAELERAAGSAGVSHARQP